VPTENKGLNETATDDGIFGASPDSNLPLKTQLKPLFISFIKQFLFNSTLTTSHIFFVRLKFKQSPNLTTKQTLSPTC
jgi:hypothetical protein